MLKVLKPVWYRNEINEKIEFNMQKYISVKLDCTEEL